MPYNREHRNAAVSLGFATTLVLTQSACEGTWDQDAPETEAEPAHESTPTASPDTLYDPVLHDYTFTGDVMRGDAEAGDYVGAAASVDNVTAEHVESLKPHLTDRLYVMRSEGVVHREENGLVQDGEVKIERMLVTNYVADSEANVSVCRDYSEYGLRSTTSPDKNVTIDFTEDVRETNAVRADGRWILPGEQQSEHTCDDIRTAS